MVRVSFVPINPNLIGWMYTNLHVIQGKCPCVRSLHNVFLFNPFMNTIEFMNDDTFNIQSDS